MYDRQTIANRIYIARKDKELNQLEVGKILGIGQSSYSDLETGKRDMTIKELFLLSKLFDKPVIWFLGIDHKQQLTDQEYLEVGRYINFILSRRKNKP